MAPTSIASITISRARHLRKNMSDAEAALWQELRELKRLGLHVRKQAPIGRYIADFAILKQKLVIEVDGHQHLEQRQVAHDKKRDAWLTSQGYKVLRFSTGDLTEAMDGCVEEIMREAGIL